MVAMCIFEGGWWWWWVRGPASLMLSGQEKLPQKPHRWRLLIHWVELDGSLQGDAGKWVCSSPGPAVGSDEEVAGGCGGCRGPGRLQQPAQQETLLQGLETRQPASCIRHLQMWAQCKGKASFRGGTVLSFVIEWFCVVWDGSSPTVSKLLREHYKSVFHFWKSWFRVLVEKLEKNMPFSVISVAPHYSKICKFPCIYIFKFMGKLHFPLIVFILK